MQPPSTTAPLDAEVFGLGREAKRGQAPTKRPTWSLFRGCRCACSS
jgi:hypothetical protein